MKLVWPGLTEIPYVIIDQNTKDIYNTKNTLPPSLKHLNTTKNKYVELQIIQQLFTKEELKSAMFVLYDLIDTFSADPFIEIPSKTHKKTYHDTKKSYVSLSTLLKFILVWPACSAFKKTKNAIYAFLEDSSKLECHSNEDTKFNETSPLLGYSISMADKYCQTSNQYESISTNKIPISPANQNSLSDQLSTSSNKCNTSLINERITSESDSKSPLKIKLLLNGKNISEEDSLKKSKDDGFSSTLMCENLKRKNDDSTEGKSFKRLKLNKDNDEINTHQGYTPLVHINKEKSIKIISKFHQKTKTPLCNDELSTNQLVPNESFKNNHKDKSTKDIIFVEVMDEKVKKSGSKMWVLEDYDESKVYATYLHVPSNINIIRCTLKGCGQCFDTVKSANLHHLTHHHASTQDNKPCNKTLTCDQCSYETSSNKWFLMLNHMMIQHQTTLAASPVTCQLCGLEFNSQQSLQEHFNYHYCNQYKCLQCGLLLHTWKQVKIHKEECLQSSNNYSKSTYLCPYCPFVFHKRTLHRLHVSSHSDCGLQCVSCQMAFPDWSHLRKHYKLQHPQLVEQYLRGNNEQNKNNKNNKANYNINKVSKKDKKTLVDEVVQKRIADYFVFDNNKNNNNIEENITDNNKNEGQGDNADNDETKLKILKSEEFKSSCNRDNNEVNDDEGNVSCVSNATSQDDDYNRNNHSYDNNNTTDNDNSYSIKRFKDSVMLNSLSLQPSSSGIKKRRLKAERSQCARTKALRWKDDDDYGNHINNNNNNNNRKKNKYKKIKNSHDDYDEDNDHDVTDNDDSSCPVLSSDDVTYPPLVDHLYFKYHYNNSKGTVNFSFRTTRSQANLVSDVIGPPEAHYVSNNDVDKEIDTINSGKNNNSENNNNPNNNNNGCDISAYLNDNDHSQQHVDVVVDNVLQQLNIVDEVKQQCVKVDDLTLSLDDLAFVCVRRVDVNGGGSESCSVGDDGDNFSVGGGGDNSFNNDHGNDYKSINNNFVDYKDGNLINDVDDNEGYVGDGNDESQNDDDYGDVSETYGEVTDDVGGKDENDSNGEDDSNEDNNTKKTIVTNRNKTDAYVKTNVGSTSNDNNSFNDAQTNMVKNNREDGSFNSNNEEKTNFGDKNNDDNPNEDKDDKTKGLARLFVQSLGGVFKKNN